MTATTAKARRMAQAIEETYGHGKSFPESFPTLVEGRGFDHSRPNAQIAMNVFRNLRTFLGLSRSSDELQSMTNGRLDECRRIQAERESIAAANDGVVCQRCGGAGGSSQWPGWTCFDCDGRGWVS